MLMDPKEYTFELDATAMAKLRKMFPEHRAAITTAITNFQSCIDNIPYRNQKV